MGEGLSIEYGYLPHTPGTLKGRNITLNFIIAAIEKSAGNEFRLYTKDPKLIAITQWHRISPDDLVLIDDKENRQVIFRTDKVLKVEYYKSAKVSYIKPLESEISIDPYGNAGNLFILGGYWKDCRMADQLPFDYVYTP